ncbi:MAG: DUF4214 domain-containing protein [Devosia sp.]|uniref:beta strand repeat-containing protein n=1 Tax=Devosia sp. TaxID=1871048 RepID=UPI0019EAE477|nr:DUF4214 domain-containing protein [Devosia sp.]MBF0679903.1 DUF4214 domain-containing protein [Devosia sp.]
MATIQGVYVALFGRPADPAGLAYFNGVTNNGQNLAAINNLAGQPEYTSRFANMNNAQIVNSIYQSLFGRDAEAAGLNFFVDALNKGTLNINNIAIAILDGAQGNDAVVRDAKIASANVFTAALDTPTEVAAYSGQAASDAGSAFLSGVTTTPKTAADADAAVEKLVIDSNLGKIDVALTAGTDVVSTSAATTLQTTDKNDTIAAGTAGFWAAADEIDGGFGTDTLNATIGASLTVNDGSLATPGFLRSVEILNITATGNATLNLKNAVGVATVNSVTNAGNLTVEGIALATVAKVSGNGAGVTTFSFDGVTGSADAKTIVADTATAGGVTVAGIEALTISSTGGSNLGTVTAADATSVTLAGSGALSLSLANGAATSVTNTSTGAVTIDLTAATKLATYTGSAVVDIVTVDTNGLTANLAISTGAGNDTINADVATATSAFTLTLTGGEGSDLFNIGALGNINSVVAADFEKSLVTIADFNAAQDVIDVNLTGAKTAFNNVQLSDVQTAATLLAAVTVVEGLGADDGHAIFVYKGDTYLFQNDGTDGLAAGDGLVKITGLTNLDLLTAANFI